MRTETQDIVIEAVRAAPGLIATGWTLNHLVAIATFIFIVLQAAYLIRKWIREEAEWGIRIKRWAQEKFTQPGDLS